VDSSLLTINNAGNANLNYNLEIEYQKNNTLSWLSVNPPYGTVPGNNSNKVNVIVNSAGLLNTNYYANILVNSNDPVNPHIKVPVTLDVITFVPGQEMTSILIFPNPVNDFLNISSGSMIKTVLLINNIGQEVYQKDCQTKNIRINTKEFKNGIYTLQLKTALGTVTKKIIIR